MPTANDKLICYCSVCIDKLQSASTIRHHIQTDLEMAQSPDFHNTLQQIYQDTAMANSARLDAQLVHVESQPASSSDGIRESDEASLRSIDSGDFALPLPPTSPIPSTRLCTPPLPACSQPPTLSSEPETVDSDLASTATLHHIFPDADSDDITESIIDNLFSLPPSQAQLQSELLGDYKCPSHPPTNQERAFDQGTLTPIQKWSLKLYITWKRSRGTVAAFTNHKALLEEALSIQLLSLYMVRELARRITGVTPRYIAVCPNNCIAYTGQFEHLTVCPGKRRVKDTSQKKVRTLDIPCRLPKIRSASGTVPQAQMLVVPVLAKIRAMFANETFSGHLRYRDRLMRQTMALLAKGAEIRYQDFGNGRVQEELRKRGFTFSGSPNNDDFELAFAFTSDGVQLTMKKESDTWVLMIIILDLPPSLRYRMENTIVVCVTPGPYPPGNLESFLYPLLQEMATLGEGVWVWDALRNAYFVLRAFIVLALADQMGSAKLNGLVGHIGRVGDRYSEMIAARSAEDGKYLYYPLFSDTYVAVLNPDRPRYNARNLPLRTEEKYWSTISQLGNTSSSSQRAALVTQTGVSRLPLLAASKAFTYPSWFFPSDPFHLLYENCAAWLWDLMLDSGHLTREQGAEFGRLLAYSNTTLPPSFSGPVRNLYTKRNSQYKIYEWMNVVHMYTVPILQAVGADSRIIDNYALFVEIAEEVTHLRGHTEADLEALEGKIAMFLRSYEHIYINSPADIVRCRLCIAYLIHIPRQIRWHGSFRIGSQATCELTIGHLSKKIRSAKAPFINLANILVEDEVIACLDLRMPHLHPPIPLSSKNQPRLIRNFPITRTTLRSTSFQLDLAAIKAAGIWSDWDGAVGKSLISRWGKYRMNIPRATLTTLLSESNRHAGASMKHRSSRYFEAITKDGNIWGEARAIYQRDGHSPVLVYNAFGSVRLVLRVCHVAKMTGFISAIPLECIQAIVGVFGFKDDLTILRKHAALSMLQVADRGLPGPTLEADGFGDMIDVSNNGEESLELDASDDEYYNDAEIEN
ncbi:hypothetical protein ONZ45_g3888 [Pleurotus djamor]|nr:hypothetical protein ONZ45_g3888 [Pleurotus djamor]